MPQWRPPVLPRPRRQRIQWHVHRAGRFIGAIVERESGFVATRLVEGERRSQRFTVRDAAAAWLAKLAGG